MELKKHYKQPQAVGVGALFMLLALIGAITLVAASVRLTSRLLDNSRQKQWLENILTPVVMFDPTPFSSPADIDNERLLLYSMWVTLSSERVNDYKRSEINETLLVPASDLEAAAYSLFRDKVTLEHKTISDGVDSYFYDKENNTYQVTTSGYLYVYRPQVMEISKNGDAYDILVSYIPPDNAWGSVYTGSGSQTANKVMVYVMEQVDSNWYLTAVKDPPDEFRALIPGSDFATPSASNNDLLKESSDLLDDGSSSTTSATDTSSQTDSSKPGDSSQSSTPDVSSTPPASTPPASTPPASTPPASTPPASTPPASTPPASTPPASTPPASTPPASTPPASTPPASTPPPVEPSSAPETSTPESSTGGDSITQNPGDPTSSQPESSTSSTPATNRGGTDQPNYDYAFGRKPSA